MNSFEEQQKFLPKKLFDSDEIHQTRSLHSDCDSTETVVFSAPPILFDLSSRFYEDFIQQITQKDPQLNRYGWLKSAPKQQEQKNSQYQNPYRKFSLQIEEYNSYYTVNVPSQHHYLSLSIEQQILNNLQRASKWARDQYGSRAVQNFIQNGQNYIKDAIYESLMQECIELTKDKFGNYVFQKIFQRGEPQHCTKLLKVMKENILEFSQNCYGCRVVQKAIQYTKDKYTEQQEIARLLQPYTMYLVENINGNHVMQKCFQIIQLSFLQKMINSITQNCKRLSLHAYGCRVIQKYLQKLSFQILSSEEKMQSASASQKAIISHHIKQIQQKQKMMFQKLLAIGVELSQCQYGNYVMQHIVSYCKGYKQNIQELFYNNFVQLSCNKYASNVIQKVIKLAQNSYKQNLAKKICQSDSLVHLAKHQYGNYVLQSLVQKISSQSRLNLKNKFRQNSIEINKSQYGRHVFLLLQKLR